MSVGQVVGGLNTSLTVTFELISKTNGESLHIFKQGIRNATWHFSKN